MLKIDNSLLQELGLGSLPDSEKNSLLRHIYETLEMRVGMRLADQMTNEQLDEFEQYFEAKDDAGAFKWLETNFPNYKEIVQEEFDKLKAEVGQSAPQILSASQQNAAQNLQTAVEPPGPATAPQPAAPFDPLAAAQAQAVPQQPQAPDVQGAFSQPMQGPNTVAPMQPSPYGTPPQAAPAPAEPYAAPPVPPPVPQPMPQQPQAPPAPGQAPQFSPPPSGWQPPQPPQFP